MPEHDRRWLDDLFPTDGDRTLPWSDLGSTVALYRPVGPDELRLIVDSGYRAYPPRLPDQPIFYPVLNFDYAEEIARDWNAAETGSQAGFVTRFEIDGPFVRRYDIKVVGSEKIHRELWVPAEDLESFNRHILGEIRIVAAYYGENYRGEIDAATNLPLWAVRG